MTARFPFTFLVALLCTTGIKFAYSQTDYGDTAPPGLHRRRPWLPTVRQGDSVVVDETESEFPANTYSVPRRKSASSSIGGYSVQAPKKHDTRPFGGGYAAQKGNDAAQPYAGLSRDQSNVESTEKQVITGIPDLSDPCFRRYSNSIIVNAQPYERRSSISLVNCKTQCLQSQIGVYSCRSFVYDNINQVCDLFAHVGDQAPARLLRFQSRDYFEPTAAISCKADFSRDTSSESITRQGFTPEPFQSTSTQTTTETTTTTTATVAPPVIQGSAIAIVDEKEIENISVPADSFNAVTATTQVANRAKSATESACGPGLIPRFLKTSDFELYNYDDLKMDQVSLDECIELCSNSLVTRSNGSTIKCSSFEYSDGFCILSAETAVPLGNGQLKQKPGTDYYEKACVDEKLANECGSSVFNRFPQMILVGFAETVVDAPSLQHCFDNCLNSKKLYGFKCISGMYYFEEPQLNCILNTEDRNSQPDLFTSENSDLVDYFETTCGQSPKKSGTRRFASPTQSAGSSFRKDFVEPGASQRLRQTYGWTDWSPCTNSTASAVQTRHKICAEGRICGKDIRKCSQQRPTMSMDEIVNAIRRAKCPVDECCPVFGGCKIGIIQKSLTRRMEWCTNPCSARRPAS